MYIQWYRSGVYSGIGVVCIYSGIGVVCIYSGIGVVYTVV